MAFVIRDWVIVLLRFVRIILLFIMGVRLVAGMRVGPLLALAVRGLLVRGLLVRGRDRLLALRRGWACKGMCVVGLGWMWRWRHRGRAPYLFRFLSKRVVVDAGGGKACMA